MAVHPDNRKCPQKSAGEVYRILCAAYPDARWSPRHRRSPFQILVLTILSAQTTDRQVDLVADALFSRYPDPETLAEAGLPDIETIIHSTGFFHAKARYIMETSKDIHEKYGDHVPQDMATLLSLPGVGRKTANIVLYHAFSKNEGVAVDTHVQRLAGRIGFSDSTDPGRIEKDLMRLFQNDQWGHLTDLLITHGRRCCMARGPLCEQCPISGYCVFFRGGRESGLR